MAALSPIVIGPTAVLSILGYLHGPDRTAPTPNDKWLTATVNVVIPALNEEATIGLTIASVAWQTRRLERVILVDDGSRDRTVDMAERTAAGLGLPLIVIRRKAPLGKTPTVKRQAREFPADVEVILDGDTVLESPEYIDELVRQLYQSAGIASASGMVMPLRDRDRSRYLGSPGTMAMPADVRKIVGATGRSLPSVRRGITNLYRENLYQLLQRFVYRGQVVFFGSIVNPIGCAVAYRQKYLLDLFDTYEPQ